MKQTALDFDITDRPPEATGRLESDSTVASRGISPTQRSESTPPPPPGQLSEADRQSFAGLEWYLSKGK
jgi:hypothetical protein